MYYQGENHLVEKNFGVKWWKKVENFPPFSANGGKFSAIFRQWWKIFRHFPPMAKNFTPKIFYVFF